MFRSSTSSFFFLLAPLGALLAMDASAVEPCSHLPQGGKVDVTIPESVGDVACDANCSGIHINFPMPSNPVWGFTDNSHLECAIQASGPANGKCKKSTVCPPGAPRTQRNGVWKCVTPSYSTHKDCPFHPPKPLPFSINSAEDYVIADPSKYVPSYTNIHSNVERAAYKPKGGCYVNGSNGLNQVVLRGPAVGAAVNAAIPGLPAINVRLSFQDPSDMQPAQCLLPNCVIAEFKLPSGVPTGSQQLDVSLLSGRKASTSFTVVEGRPWDKVECPKSTGGGYGGGGIATKGDPNAQAAQSPQLEGHNAGMSCPGTETVNGTTHAFTRYGSNFNVHAASGAVTATAYLFQTEECGWQDALTFKLEGPSGQEIAFTPQLAGGSVTYQPVTLQLSNGDYSLNPPDEQHPNPAWPYGFQITLQFAQ